MSYLSGKLGKVRVNGATLAVTKWRVIPKCQLVDVTSSESNGFGEYVAGVKDGDVELSLFYDYGGIPYATISPGSTLTNLKLYLNDTTGAYWQGNALVEEAPNQSEVRGGVTIELRGKFSGGLTAPAS